MIDVQKVGAFISECRKENEWTQKQLGEKLGVTDRAVSKWETGRSLPDISLIEPLCGLFGISVSEILAGKKMEAEEYQKETDELLIRTIDEHQLIGFQIVIHLLTVIAILIFFIPFFIKPEGQWLPGFDRANILCWTMAGILAGIIWYLDEKLPARKYRYSNPWIEGLAGIGLFGAMMFITFYNAGGMKALVNEALESKIRVAAIGAASGIYVVGIRAFAAHKRKKEWEQETIDRKTAVK